MAMLFVRGAAPAWVVILGLGVFFAPAGMATTVMLVALGFICTGAVITAGVWKRTLYRPTPAFRTYSPAARQPPETIDADFVGENVTPMDKIRG